MIKQMLTLIWKKRTQNAFMILEIVLAFLILFAVFSLVSKFMKKYNTPIGYNYERTGVIVADFDVFDTDWFADDSEEGYDVQKYIDKKEQLQRSLVETKGIKAASFTNSVAPFAGNNWSSGNEGESDELITYERAHMLITDQHFADVYELNLTEGRWFDENDINNKYLPILVNQNFVDKYYKKEGSIVGKHMLFWGEERVITGVVDYFKYNGDFSDEKPMMFPYLSQHDQTAYIQFRFDERENPNWEMALQQTLEQELKGVDFSFYKMKDARWGLNRQYWAPMLGMLVLCTFLVINIAMGLFGVLQYNIKKRRGEIGLRKAIGATNGSVRTQFVTETMLLTGLALLVGLAIAVQVPLLNLFEIEDSTLYFGMGLAATVILVLVFLCSLIPSSLAARIQPAVALHEE